MREKLAIAVCMLTLALVVALSLLFAVRHNPAPASAPPAAGSPPAPEPGPSTAEPDMERGRTLYGQYGCATCHAIAGSGNPRNPLDGIGDRRTSEELPHWILGTGVATDALPPAVRQRKQRYHDMPPEDLHALVSYLSSLK